MPEHTTTCQFCGESGFDWIGLKNHIARGYCENFEKIETIAEERSRKRLLEKSAK